MNEDAMKAVEQYLERVRIYMPSNSEEALTEIRTHLIEEAEAIGGGSVTVDSMLAAISRLGDPKAVANDYAGTGKSLWHVPVEYVQPIMRILVVLVRAADYEDLGGACGLRNVPHSWGLDSRPCRGKLHR